MEIDPQMDCMFGLDPFGICCAPSEQDECGVCDGDGSFCEEFEMPDITDCDGVDNGTAWWEENGTCNTSCLTETRDDCIDGTPCSACCYSNLEWICHPNDPYETNWIGGQCSTSDWTGQNPEMTPTGLFVWIDRCTQTDDPYFCWGKRKALFNVGQACSCSPQAAAYLGEYYSGTSNECGCTYAGEVEMEDIYISCCKIGYGVGGSCNVTPIGTEIDCIDPGNACEDFGQCPTGDYYMPECFSANSGCSCSDGETMFVVQMQ
jgi:hypothetical protein